MSKSNCLFHVNRLMNFDRMNLSFVKFSRFKDECLLKLGDLFYEECMKSFDCLPIAALVHGQLFCIHGCISPEIRHIKEVIDIHRTCEPPTKGALCDILWADPTDGYDNERVEQKSEMFTHNGPRGCSYNVSYKAMCKFLDDNDLLCVIRAHQVQSAGCKMYKKHEKTLFPTLVTIFSAPNYCKKKIFSIKENKKCP